MSDVDVQGDDKRSDEDIEMYSVTMIRDAYAKYSGRDDWGMPAFYEASLIAAIRGEYDDE